MLIRDVTLADATAIVEIYNYYIQSSHATFELETSTTIEMEQRLTENIARGFPFLVAEMDDKLAAYAYARPFRPRAGYRFAAEIAAYVRPGFERRGLGQGLYRRLIPQLFNDGFHTLIATIALPNDASVFLHEKFGFKKAGHFREVGRKFERWIDVGYWQLFSQT